MRYFIIKMYYVVTDTQEKIDSVLSEWETDMVEVFNNCDTYVIIKIPSTYYDFGIIQK